MDDVDVNPLQDELRQKINKAAESWLLDLAKTLSPANTQDCLDRLCKWYEASTKERSNKDGM